MQGDAYVAHFYEDKNEQDPTWEDMGGFNTHLLTEIRNALLSVESDIRPAQNTACTVASEWIKRLPLFDFPDDEIG